MYNVSSNKVGVQLSTIFQLYRGGLIKKADGLNYYFDIR